MLSDDKKIKVCFISPKVYPLFDPEIKAVFGGIEVDLFLIATELAKDPNFDIAVITADYGQNQVEDIKGVKIVKSLVFSENKLLSAKKIWNAMEYCNSEIYFQEGSSWGTFLTAIFCKIKRKVFVYRTAHQNDCDGTYLRSHFFAGKAFSWALKKAGQVIVQNEGDKKLVRRNYGLDSIVIRNAHVIPPLSESFRDIILWVARSAKFKRPELFVKLAKEFQNENFMMICPRAFEDKNYEQLVNYAGQIDNLEFIRRVPFGEIDKYFERAKLFVSTSDSEGFPNTFVQACKAATPIVSLSVNPDNFLENYKCGMCANGDWGFFLKKIKILLKNSEQKKYSRNAKIYAEEKHDIKKIAEKYKHMFEEIAFKR